MDIAQYDSYKEIHKSYESMRETVKTVLSMKAEIAELYEKYDDVVFLGCGSSYWASLSAARCQQKYTKKKTWAVKASEAYMHRSEYTYYKNPLFIVPTRSGKTKELLLTMEFLKKTYPDSAVISISEYEENPFLKKSDVSIHIPWADEVSICQTRSFLNLYTAMITMIGMIGNDELVVQLQNYLLSAESLYETIEENAKSIVNKMMNPKIVALGSGTAYGTVIEGAYIVEEMAQTVATFYQTLEYRHGPIVTADEDTYVFLCHTNEENIDLEKNILIETGTHGAKTILCGYHNVCEEMTYNFTLDLNCTEEIKGIYFTTILQHIAFYLAIKFGFNPDKPGNLVKYITY